MTDTKCEVCGEPATANVIDGREIEPVPGELDGKSVLFANFEVHSRHAFCAAHERPGLEVSRNGRWRVVQPVGEGG